MKFTGNGLPNGTVLIMGVRYDGAPRVFTYAMLKVGGLWYVTGSGRVPVAAGWAAVERWLGKDGRAIVWVKVATGWEDLYPVPTLKKRGCGQPGHGALGCTCDPTAYDPRDDMSPGSIGSENG